MSKAPRMCIGQISGPEHPATLLALSTLGGIVKERPVCEEHRDAFLQTHALRPIEATYASRDVMTYRRALSAAERARKIVRDALNAAADDPTLPQQARWHVADELARAAQGLTIAIGNLQHDVLRATELERQVMQEQGS